MIKNIKKPWGKEVLLEINNKFMFKKLYMNKGHQCSIQFHKKKKETIFVLKGKLKIYYGKTLKKLKYKILKSHDFITINPRVIHRMKAINNCIYLESSSPEINDVVRLVDDYGRI